jgi:uncharacterized protein
MHAISRQVKYFSRPLWPAIHLLIFLSLFTTSRADEAAPMIAIIIDDLGYHHTPDASVIDLKIPVTCAFLPDTPYSKSLALAAHERGKEIMLHMPMESMNHKALGPDGLELNMSEHEFKSSLSHSLDSIPYVQGINNHMGSLLTQHPGHMAWLMHELMGRPSLYFIDSRTTTKTVALQLAREYGVPSLKRDVFIDSKPNDEAYATSQLLQARRLAKHKGFAVAIGHPFPETLAAIKKMSQKMKGEGIRFVTVSQLISELDRRQPQWHAYLSPSLKAAKN